MIRESLLDQACVLQNGHLAVLELAASDLTL